MEKDEKRTDSKVIYAAPALEKGINVIELLATSPEGLTMSEIAARLGFKSMSEIFRVIMVMERRQWLIKSPDTDRFTVTHSVLETIYRAIPSHDLLMISSHLMPELSKKIEQSCHLVVLNGRKGLVITRQESAGPTGFAVRRGTEIDPVRTASGHVLMAFSRPDIVEAILESDEGLTEKERARIERVRVMGYELMPSIRTRGVTDMSCPIFGFDGYAVAALTIPFLELIDGTQAVSAKEALNSLKSYAQRISQGIGGNQRTA